MSHPNNLLLSGMQILVEDEWIDHHALIIEGKVIKQIVPKESIKEYSSFTHYEFPKSYYLIPGFIDLHVHGAKGCDVMDGHFAALNTISQTLAKEGVTGFLATTMTASHAKIEAVLHAIVAAKEKTSGARILGVHLEGPFISSAKKGAQCLKETEHLNYAVLAKWLQIASDALKLITLAPELPGSLSLIRELKAEGVIVSLGHTNATFKETEAAMSEGASHTTHLFNAMRDIHQREPGVAIATLLSEKLTAELIVDGFHCHPAMVNLAYRLKGQDKLMLVTDAMRAKCLGDGEYDLGGQNVIVQNEKATLGDGTLAGSTLTMPKAIKNMMQFTQCSLKSAIRLASFNPAKLLGLDKQKGSILEGKDADLVVLNQTLDVALTVCEGREVYYVPL